MQDSINNNTERLPTLKSRAKHDGKPSHIIMGATGVGKSTLLRKISKDETVQVSRGFQAGNLQEQIRLVRLFRETVEYLEGIRVGVVRCDIHEAVVVDMPGYDNLEGVTETGPEMLERIIETRGRWTSFSLVKRETNLRWHDMDRQYARTLARTMGTGALENLVLLVIAHEHEYVTESKAKQRRRHLQDMVPQFDSHTPEVAFMGNGEEGLTVIATDHGENKFENSAAAFQYLHSNRREWETINLARLRREAGTTEGKRMARATGNAVEEVKKAIRLSAALAMGEDGSITLLSDRQDHNYAVQMCKVVIGWGTRQSVTWRASGNRFKKVAEELKRLADETKGNKVTADNINAELVRMGMTLEIAEKREHKGSYFESGFCGYVENEIVVAVRMLHDVTGETSPIEAAKAFLDSSPEGLEMYGGRVFRSTLNHMNTEHDIDVEVRKLRKETAENGNTSLQKDDTKFIMKAISWRFSSFEETGIRHTTTTPKRKSN